MMPAPEPALTPVQRLMLQALDERELDTFAVVARVLQVAAETHPDFELVAARRRQRERELQWDEELLDQAQASELRELARETLAGAGCSGGRFDNTAAARVGNQLVGLDLAIKGGPSSGMQPRTWRLA